jgi:outer membrane lipoprotein carrier protein
LIEQWRGWRRLGPAIGLALLAALPVAAQTGSDLSRLAQAVDAHYNGLKTLSAQFEESYQGGGLRRVERGTMRLAKPGRMRWEYSSPRSKLFVCDGHNAWFYVPGERQARHMAVKKLSDLRTPLLYLLGHTRLEKEFVGLSVATGEKPVAGGSVVLRGVPRAMADRVREVLLEIDGHNTIRRIAIEESDGARTEFRFAALRENEAIAAGEFAFAPPKGVEVLNAEGLAP